MNWTHANRFGNSRDEESAMSTAKEEARELLDRIPDNATWDDIMYQFYVEKKVEKALQEVETGNVLPHEVVKERYPTE
jgi:hypothetical protein